MWNQLTQITHPLLCPSHGCSKPRAMRLLKYLLLLNNEISILQLIIYIVNPHEDVAHCSKSIVSYIKPKNTTFYHAFTIGIVNIYENVLTTVTCSIPIVCYSQI